MRKDYLILKDLKKTFGKGDSAVTAVNAINLNVKEGELITLLGPSGCGKTTTLRMIAGFQTPTSGDILIDGESVNTLPPNKRPTAMVFQNYALFPHLTVRENIAFGLKTRGENKEEIIRKVDEIMNLIGLNGLADRQPRELSGGQQQRVSLARAMIMEPKVLLFDEPLSNLDAKLRVSTRLEIRKLQQRVGITSVYVTHDQEEAMTLSDKVIVMKDGMIQQIGSPSEIYSHPCNRFVAGFIGKANFLDATIKDIKNEQLILDFMGKEIIAPQWDKSFKTGDAVVIVARPESIIINEPSKKHIEGNVINSVYFGSQMLYEVKISDEQVLRIEVADPQQQIQFSAGIKVGLSFKDRSLHILSKENGGEIVN